MKRFLIAYKNTSLEAPEGEFLIGRSTECHLVLEDPSVSRVHAAIVKDGDILRAVDKGSRNGVRVNKKPVKGSCVLQHGDQVIIGHQVIRIVCTDREEKPERTMAIQQCPSCGRWLSGNSAKCSGCGASIKPLSEQGEDDTMNVTAVGRPPISMVLELAAKSIQVGRLDDAERILDNATSSLLARIAEGDPPKESELNEISAVILSRAKASKAPREISRLFSIHHAAKKLMSRDVVEQLYDIVRNVGYLSCPDMVRYLKFLDANESAFNPGERFVHRRLQGLVKLCS